jgi:hypothetical protein
MATAQTIIQRAMRQENLVNVGGAPTTDEQTEALALLNSLIQQIVGFELGELLADWQVPLSYTDPNQMQNPRDPYGANAVTPYFLSPPINTRILATITSATTIYLPQYPNDGSRISVVDTGSANTALTLDGNGRMVDGAATLLLDLSADVPAEWIYRADLGDWRQYTDLTITDNSPFPDKYDMMLVCGLAIWLAPRYGVVPSDVTAAIAADLRAKFRAQYKQYTETPPTYSLSEVQSYRLRGVFGSGVNFYNG